jgi:hypothetical protein
MMKVTSLLTPAVVAAALGACAIQEDAQTAQDDWREAIVASPITDAGCYHAVYPDMSWSPTSCTAAPNQPYSTITITDGTQFTVGNGSDYALQVSELIKTGVGTFPHVSGLVSEKDGTANSYSIQLNSNFMSGTAACAAAGSNCLSWAQFVYSSSEQAAFMQNWLIGYGTTCPNANWFSDGQGDCYSNSDAASVPTLPLTNDTDLSTLKMSGTAVAGGNDTLVFASGTEAFTASEPDSTTNLASAWNASEFNIIGDGNASEAVFNKSTAIEVRIAVKDGSTAAPTCVVNGGTTGETNNRVLDACDAFAGTTPSIEFRETGK